MFTRKDWLLAKRQRDLDFKKRKYHDDPEKERQAVKKRYNDKEEYIKQYKKEKYVEHQTWNISYKKAKHHENSEVHLMYNKCKYHEIPEARIKYHNKFEKQTDYQKRGTREILKYEEGDEKGGTKKMREYK